MWSDSTEKKDIIFYSLSTFIHDGTRTQREGKWWKWWKCTNCYFFWIFFSTIFQFFSRFWMCRLFSQRTYVLSLRKESWNEMEPQTKTLSACLYLLFVPLIFFFFFWCEQKLSRISTATSIWEFRFSQGLSFSFSFPSPTTTLLYFCLTGNWKGYVCTMCVCVSGSFFSPLFCV